MAATQRSAKSPLQPASPAAEVGVEVVPGLFGKDGQHAAHAKRVLPLIVAEAVIEVLEHAMLLHVEAEVTRLGIVRRFLCAAKVVVADQRSQRPQPAGGERLLQSI